MDSLKPIASNRHFAIFGTICVVFTLIGVNAQLHTQGPSLDPGHRGVVPLYLSTMIGEWFFLYFVWRGVRSYGGNIFSLTGRWGSPQAAAVDVAIGLVFGYVLLWFDALAQHLLGQGQAKSIDQLLPQGPLEIALWVAVSITAGITEELTYRGYLMRQLAARFHNMPLAVVVQGLWFAGMHAYEGLHAVVTICAIGLAFGVVAVWLKQLKTNMIAHAVVDLVAGIAPNLVRL